VCLGYVGGLGFHLQSYKKHIRHQTLFAIFFAENPFFFANQIAELPMWFYLLIFQNDVNKGSLRIDKIRKRQIPKMGMCLTLSHYFS